jgi:excisionase family DNA binding protein
MIKTPPETKPQRRAMTIDDAAIRVGVSRRTIYNWLSNGRVDWCRTAGGNIRIYEDSLWRPATSDRPTEEEMAIYPKLAPTNLFNDRK